MILFFRTKFSMFFNGIVKCRCWQFLLVSILMCFSLLLNFYVHQSLMNNFTMISKVGSFLVRENVSLGIFHDKHLENPYLHQECFIYDKFEAKFNCSDVYPYNKYSSELIFKCASNFWNIIR